jgi:SMEK domain-containing protein
MITFDRQDLIEKIILRLTWLKAKVDLSNKLNLTDVNIISENFYRDFLNLVFGYNLISENILKPNAETIYMARRKSTDIPRCCSQILGCLSGGLFTLEKATRRVRHPYHTG